MKILKAAYEVLLYNTPLLPPESGGIIGGTNGIVTEIHFDAGQNSNHHPAIYVPNIESLNKVIAEWSLSNIEFYGIFHSHYPQDRTLSTGDIKYIKKIMQVMPSEIQLLLFPIILPRQDVIAYRASNDETGISIACDKIEII